MSIINLSYNHQNVSGVIEMPGDKSITHRSIIFGSLAKGVTKINNFLDGEDCRRTIDIFRQLGVKIEHYEKDIIIHGKGWSGLKKAEQVLYAGNSGTTARLLLGVLAGCHFPSILSGDRSLLKRPMSRVTIPLEKMGAKFFAPNQSNYLPLTVDGGLLNAIDYTLPVASAQVKSAIILAAIQAEGQTVIIENIKSRDHTEKMLKMFGGEIEIEENQIFVPGRQSLEATHLSVPGDFSSAAFMIVLAAINTKSDVLIRNIGLNPTRTGLLEVLKNMNAKVEVIDEDQVDGEITGSIRIQHSNLVGTVIEGTLIPRLIDEIPVIALLATQAEGTTIIKNAQELKVKESNRIDTVVNELQKIGADIEATDDGMVIRGKTKLIGGKVNSHGDHRIGMTLAIAASITDSPLVLEDYDCINISYPDFFEDIFKLLT